MTAIWNPRGAFGGPDRGRESKGSGGKKNKAPKVTDLTLNFDAEINAGPPPFEVTLTFDRAGPAPNQAPTGTDHALVFDVLTN